MKAILPAAIAFVLALDAQNFAADGNAARGQRVFGARGLPFLAAGAEHDRTESCRLVG
jgi:hypothetical protein